MRVIAGKFKSRRLRTLRGMSLRPTSDRLRETLFDILGDAVKDAMFVDLFAGTGAVGIEAISRGALRVVFVEKHAPAAQLIRENLKSLGIIGGTEILPIDALHALETLASQHARVDFVFLDPPYADAREYQRTLEFIGAGGLLSSTGIAIAEHGKKMELPLRVEALERTRVVMQGDSVLSFYQLARAA